MKTNAEYIASSTDCPRCGSSDLEGGSFDIDTGSCGQEMNCSNCGLVYYDEYRLVGFSVLSDYLQTDPSPAEN